MSRQRALRDDPRFWCVLLAFSITTLALAVFISTDRWLYVVGTIVGHAELVMIGVHLARTRRPKKS